MEKTPETEPATTKTENDESQENSEKPSSSSSSHEAPDLEDEETRHTARIIKALLSYRGFGRDKICSVIKSFRALSKDHKQLIAEPHSQHIRNCFECIEQNQKFLESVVGFSANMFSDGAAIMQLVKTEKGTTNHFMEKVKSTLRQVIREWSELGQSERDATYTPVIAEVERYFPTKEDRDKLNIFVPGAGLGRLAWEFVEKGYSVLANEYSMFMLFTSCFFLNKEIEPNSLVFYPHVLETSNLWCYEDALKSVRFPDKNPATDAVERKNNFAMNAGDFLEISRDYMETFDCIVTAWFIDTANNVVEYIARMFQILKPGGLWVNVGPLTYHYTEMDDEVSIELPYSEIIRIVRATGFTVNCEKRLDSTYSANGASMLRYQYNCAFFSATKPPAE